MHSLTHGKFTLHFNSDLAGDVKIDMRDETIATIPGEILRMYVRKFVLGQVRDAFDTMLYRQVGEFGGLNHRDAAQVLQHIDNLTTVSTTTNPANVLHGTTYLFGCPVHITFLRVERRKDGFWEVIDPAYADELSHVEKCAGDASDGPLQSVEVPGFAGQYIAYTFPHSE
jgi:hypothetical protein